MGQLGPKPARLARIKAYGLGLWDDSLTIHGKTGLRIRITKAHFASVFLMPPPRYRFCAVAPGQPPRTPLDAVRPRVGARPHPQRSAQFVQAVVQTMRCPPNAPIGPEPLGWPIPFATPHRPFDPHEQDIAPLNRPRAHWPPRARSDAATADRWSSWRGAHSQDPAPPSRQSPDWRARPPAKRR